MKTTTIQTRFKPNIAEMVKEAAKTLGLNQSEFIRLAATERAKKELKGARKND